MAPPGSPYAYFDSSIESFISASMNEVVGRLTLGSRFGVERDQLRAWEAEIEILRVSLNGLSGHIYIEFEVPRIGSRADTVLLIGGTVLVVEFKVGMSEFARGALDQVWDYQYLRGLGIPELTD